MQSVWWKQYAGLIDTLCVVPTRQSHLFYIFQGGMSQKSNQSTGVKRFTIRVFFFFHQKHYRIFSVSGSIYYTTTEAAPSIIIPAPRTRYIYCVAA